MALYVGDYLADTAHLSAAEHGAYLLLIMHYWRTGGLPDDDGALARIVRMKAGEWRKARPIIEAFFQPGWKHKRIESEIAEAARISEAGRKAGLASAEARRNGRSTDVERPLHDRSNDLPTKAQPSQSQPQKEDAAGAAPDPEVELFRRGREVLGHQAGGLIAKLLTAKQKNIALARAAIEQASTKSNPREYVGAVIRGKQSADQPNWLGGIEGII